MKASDIGRIIKLRRKSIQITQQDLSLATGIGTRFISELENGKATCEIGKVLEILQALGLKIHIDE